jgi:hypothetical protein
MMGEGGFTHQPPSPKPPSPTGGNNNATQPDFADINLLPTENGLDFGVHLHLTEKRSFLRKSLPNSYSHPYRTGLSFSA